MNRTIQLIIKTNKKKKKLVKEHFSMISKIITKLIPRITHNDKITVIK